MFSATTRVIAGISVALLGGILAGGATLPDRTVLAAAPSLAPTAVESNGSVTNDAITMGAPSGATVGGWTQIGRTPVVNGDGMSLSDLRDLTAVGDQLIAIGTIEETAEGPSHRVVLSSTDGLTWAPVTVPGNDPIVTDLAASAEGILGGGSETRHGERAGALWTSPDGLAWTPVDDVPFAEVRQIVSADLRRSSSTTAVDPMCS